MKNLMPKKALFYNDSNVFGGHEVSVVEAIDFILNTTDICVYFIYYEDNDRLEDHLIFFANRYPGRMLLHPIQHYARPLESLYVIFNTKVLRRRFQEIVNIINNIKPTVVIVVQGNMEISCLGLYLSTTLGYKVISFIPITTRFQELGAKLGLLRDWLNQYFLRMPCKFITISKGMKFSLIDQGVCPDRVSLVYCGIDTNSFKDHDSRSVRNENGIKESDFVIALIGRIFFKQKGHDFLVEVLNKYRYKYFENTIIVFVGDGKDKKRLKALIVKYQLMNYVRLIPWETDITYIYSGIDLLVIPSKFEGLPLVMLEAMLAQKPIIASNRDGMKELLPADWLFEPNNPKSFIETLLRVRNNSNTEIFKKHRILVKNTHNLTTFGKNFLEEILK